MSAKKLNDKDIMNLLIDTAIANGATSADCVLSRSRGVSCGNSLLVPTFIRIAFATSAQMCVVQGEGAD